ncbi:MAG: hypothetical protein OEW62_06235 [Candidatus Bathyarchaeota archaeon]|nr:hypothetical protein [Candidatus Bathyarchaeota archaeon]MDH5595683.1 hypothetical protein [Candidatus Bathyarchaeota archaeon]
MTTSETTNKARQTVVAITVSAKLLIRRNTINGPTAKAMLAISKENLRKLLKLRGITSHVNFVALTISKANQQK